MLLSRTVSRVSSMLHNIYQKKIWQSVNPSNAILNLFLQGDRSIFTPKGLHRSIEGWVQNVTETEQLGKELYKDHYISLRYEDLLVQPFDELNRLWNFLDAGLDFPGLRESVTEEMQQNPDADWQRHKAGDLVEPLKKGKQGSWRDLFTVDDRRVFKRIAGKKLVDWGYEKDLDW